MECSYCYNHVSNYRNLELKSPTIKEITTYLAQFKYYKHLFIVFHGGEPLLTPIDKIKALLEYILTNMNNIIHIQFQTNGILLNKKWFKLFFEFQPYISLSISIDPDGEIDFRFKNDKDLKNRVFKNLIASTDYIENVGVISVAHRYNKDSFISFINQLIKYNITGLTISKLQDPERNLGNAYISEREYVDLLLKTAKYWIKEQCYTKIRLQPFSSLLNKQGSRICRYLANEHKCSMFRTFYNHTNKSEFCDHIYQDKTPNCPKQCITCDIYEFCGGGCFLEEKDSTFCDARHYLFEVLRSFRVSIQS